MATARTNQNQTTGLTNGRAENWAPEAEFTPFRALSRCQMKFPFCCLSSLILAKDPLILRGCSHEESKLLPPGRSKKADHPSAICFICIQFTGKKFYLSLALGSSKLRGRTILASTRKILAPCKLPSLHYEDPSTRDKPQKNGRGSFSG